MRTQLKEGGRAGVHREVNETRKESRKEKPEEITERKT